MALRYSPVRMTNATSPLAQSSSQSFASIAVIVGRDLVGDALMKLPFLRALRHAFPQAQIHWITSEGPTAYAGVLRSSTSGLIDAAHECPAWISHSGRGAQAERSSSSAPHFDLLIDTRNRWKLALSARREIPHRVFLAMALRYWLSDRLPFPRFAFRKKPVHLVDRLLRLVELAAQGPVDPGGGLPVSESLHKILRDKIMPAGKTYVGLAPGAGNPVKIWPLPQVEKLAAAQISKGRDVVFILGPEELKIYDALVAAFPTALFPLQYEKAWDCAKLTLEHTLAVASLLDVAVANDSGVGHMLAAVDCPLVSLFGPTSPAKLAPRVSDGRVVTAQMFGSSDMHAIPWQEVDRSVDAMLDSPRRRKGGNDASVP